jgi:ADP-heptose:LPS heptosyltransferase
MIYNIVRETFYDNLKNGDLVATMNVVEHLRKIHNNNNIKFYVENSIHTEEYNTKFYNFLLNNTDYFSKLPGEQILPWNNVSLWDYRSISGDLIKIPNTVEMTKKIVIFPIFDALYNQYRNWPLDVFKNITEQYSATEYDAYEKIICVKKDIINIKFGNWKYSTDFITNIHHILDAEIFVGGDTGTSHFAFSLNRGPSKLIYYNNGNGSINFLPFYLTNGKGELRTYWLNHYGTIWN